MSILLTDEQAQAVADAADAVVVTDPRTNQAYRLVREDVFQRMQAGHYDDSPWSAAETGLLAGQAFGRLDDTDYGEYLRDTP